MDSKQPDSNDRPGDGTDERPGGAENQNPADASGNDENEFGWFGARSDDDPDDGSPYLANSAFKDSGSFFRDRVARNLADQYGLDLRENGDAEKAGPEPVEPPEPDGAEEREAPAGPAADEAAASDAPAAEAPADSGDAAGPTVRDEDPATAVRAEAAPDFGEDLSSNTNWDPEGTAEFTPVFADDSADEPAESGAALSEAAKSTAAYSYDLGRAARDQRRPEPDPADLPESEAASGGAPGPESGPEPAERPVAPVIPAASAAPVEPVEPGGSNDPGEASGSRPGTDPVGRPAAPGAVPAPDPAGGPAAEAASGAAPEGAAKAGAAGKKPKRKKPLWWRVTRVGLVAALVMVVAVVGGFTYFYSVIQVPDATQADAVAEGSTFYYADGETVLTERGVNREPVSLDEVPEHVQNAILSAENRGFWDEPGVSVSGTARAVWSTVTGKQVQGGSTITQQMVRNYYEGLSQDQTLERKLKEIIISLKVDRSKDKEWILEQYLNTIYFGRNAYGIQAAAEAYYHKDVGDLTPDEAAFLAAAIQQPTKFGFADSDTTPEMENRWEYVVGGLVDMESITPAEAGEYEFPKPEKERPQDGIDLSGYKGYMFQQAMDELADLGYTEDNINRGGFEIVTTFDRDLMDAAKEAVESTVPVDDLPEGVRVGLSAVDPATGEVVAFYGGKDYFENQYDSAFLGTAQAGSAMKPYVLAAALRSGLSLNTMVDGTGPRTIAGSTVQNAGNAPGGGMNLIQATTVSNNLGFIDLAERVGLEEVAQTAYDMGLPEDTIDLVPVLPLGVNSVSPTNQAGGYATFANGGEHVETHVVRSILNREGEDERPEVERNRVLTEEQAADATYAMRQVVTSGTGTSANFGLPAAGKTGTTDSSVAAWFVGYTPQFSSAVGIYSGDNQPFSVPGWGALSGGTLPATVWRAFMQKAMEGEEYKDFPQPSFGGTTHNWAPAPPPEPETPVEGDGTGEEPGATDPGTTEPGTTEPGGTEPGGTEPGATDPGTTEPGTTEPGTTEPGTIGGGGDGTDGSPPTG
ncbi:transglycosylase domain-containing protein [Actinorugispora endophytica]|uniref:Membrane peptidoglycan carboxypeptidase n=1 Tax=Actinorugispora endophytica TaxID=1605990 RepID=A0A4V3D8X1_9ACTN|nr:transglycosylase domain-containing protein [Actinorugispora endophytica]TDQ53580.1 membrane peptidoglycan carboxypeptidase [Actinorugispora endophytica]